METKTNRIIIRNGNYTNAEAISILLHNSGLEPTANIDRLTLMCNALAQTVAEDEAGHVDLFVQKRGDACFLCANLYAIYLTFNNADHTLPALRAVIDESNAMVCRAVDADLFVVQFRFPI